MKVFVQNLTTNFYLDEHSTWTPDIMQATDFGSPKNALNVCLERRLADCCLRLKFQSPQFDSTVSLKDAKCMVNSPALRSEKAETTSQAYKVLIADDSEDDRFLLRDALNRLPYLAIVGEVSDGKEAISYLAGEDDYSDRA